MVKRKLYYIRNTEHFCLIQNKNLAACKIKNHCYLPLPCLLIGQKRLLIEKNACNNSTTSYQLFVLRDVSNTNAKETGHSFKTV